MATLRDVKVGESCTVAALKGVGAVKRRIMDMGLTKGTEHHWETQLSSQFVATSFLSVRMRLQALK